MNSSNFTVVRPLLDRVGLRAGHLRREEALQASRVLGRVVPLAASSAAGDGHDHDQCG